MYLTTKELAERWKVTPQTLINMRNQGTGPTYTKLGKSVRYNIDDVKLYEKDNKK